MNDFLSFRHAVGSILCGLLIIVSLNGCGGSGGGDAAGSAQGSLTFKLSIADSAARQVSMKNSERELSEFPCETQLIETIEAEVIENETAVAEARFNCEDHQGTINNVPVGSNLKLDVFARDAEDTAIFIGSVDKLTVTGGKTTDAGTIELRQITDRAPVLDPIANKSVDENQLLTISLSSRDPDADNLTFSALQILENGETADLPVGASLTDNLDGTAIFQWKTNYGDSGYYKIIFIVNDNSTLSPGPLSDSESIIITVGDKNRPPELNPIGARTVTAGEILQFTISANDPDVDNILTFNAENLPKGATITQNPGRTAIFQWQTQYTETQNDTGNYSVNFKVTDNGDPIQSDSELVAISVKRNEPPQISYDLAETSDGSRYPDEKDGVPTFEVEAGETLEIIITASDPNANDILTFLDPEGSPPSANFNDNQDRTARFTWTSPPFGDAVYGENDRVVYDVTFKVKDNWPLNSVVSGNIRVTAYEPNQ